MQCYEFERRVRRLNPNLHIWWGADENRPGSLYMVVKDEVVDICGVDKYHVPENIIYDKSGHIVKAGWRRSLLILLARRLIPRQKTEYVFQTRFKHGEIVPVSRIDDPIFRAIRDAEERALSRHGKNKGLLKDDVMDISKEIHKKDA